MAATISLAMIVRDEAELLGHVLADAATYCDELIVVDTGSSDDTVAVAREGGAIVHSFDWSDDFSAARNFSLAQCRCDWITYLDADDRVPPASQAAFRALKEELPGLSTVDLIKVPYRYAFAAPDSDQCIVRFELNRVLRNHAGVAFVRPVHEIILDRPGRTLRRTECWVDHRPPPERAAGKPLRNLRLLETAAAEDASSTMKYFIGMELRALGRGAEAKRYLREALAAALPDSVRAGHLVNLADCYGPGEEAERRALLLHAARIDPQRAAPLVRLGVLHYERREWAEAARWFQAAIACVPPADGAYSEYDYSWFPRDCLTVCLTELGRYEEALEMAQLALVDNPEPDRVLANIDYLRATVARRAGMRGDVPG